VTRLVLERLHGLGNDFLVLVDATGDLRLGPREAVALCDRHRGVGADGLLLAGPPRRGGDVAMTLWNADGSVAETSGNGLRCLVLALVDAGALPGPAVLVETAVGLRRAEVLRRDAAGGAEVEVELGQALLGEAEELAWPGWSARRVSTGNPHLVVLGPSLADRVLEDDAAPLSRAVDGGRNVELVAPRPGGGLEMLVYERGVGATLACGSGSVAAAAAARAAGLAGDEVRVANPGGELRVRLSGPAEAPHAFLTGPARHVARVEADLDACLAGDLLEGGAAASGEPAGTGAP